MKKRFSFSLTGGDWWKPFLVFWIIYLVFYILTTTMRRWAPPVTAHPGPYFIILFVLTLAQLLVEVVFLIVALRIIVPKVTIDGKHFSFRGRIGTFIRINVVGFLLTLVTLSVYAPWFFRRVTRYLVSETSFEGTPAEFLGRGGKLFVYFLLALWLPLIVVIGLFALTIARSAAGSVSHPGTVNGTTAAMVGVMFIVLAPFFYLMYKWYINIRWNDTTIRWQTRFWPSVGLLLGQLLLSLVTASIYWPAAVLRIYRYFAGLTVLQVGDRESGRLGFDGPIGKGFGLIWGQTLLSIITAGVYLPWAFARVGRWLLEASYVERQEAPLSTEGTAR